MSRLGNQFRTLVLLGALSGLLLWVGHVLGGTRGLTIAFAFAIIMNVGSFWFSDKIVLAMYKAKQIQRKDDPVLYDMVKDIAHKAKIPMPRVYIVPTQNPNAFATGRNPKHAAVAFTEGILHLLNKEELEGVTAHELSHIRNRDTLIMTISATIATVISYVAMMARWAFIFGGRSNDRDGGKGIELLVLAILTPLIATLIQLAISRSREYLADESAAITLKHSKGLSSALKKLEQGVKHVPLKPSSGTETTAHLFIANPFRSRGLVRLFMTHPPMDKRISRLESMKFK